MGEFFCSAPWTAIYYHVNTTSPCHSNRNELYLSPMEYLESDYLKGIKKDFVEGKVPLSCMKCFHREQRGLKSTRHQFIKFNSMIVDDESKLRENYDSASLVNLTRIEVRLSNLCNFKCRMCNAGSSSEIEKEHVKYPIIKKFNDVIVARDHNPDADHDIEEIKLLIDTLQNANGNKDVMLCLTGGEPMLIKPYYDLMDYIIKKDMHNDIILDLFTNCSVYNPLFVERMLQFKTVNFAMSIDGVGKTAEYQRHGTNWEVVESNILKYVTLPKRVMFNTAISPYVLLDISSLAKFLMRLCELNPDLKTRCYTVITPDVLHFENMNADLRKIAIEQINKACEILTPSNFDILTKELASIKRRLETSEVKDFKSFVQYTQILDKVRDESFEDVFGYKLY